MATAISRKACLAAYLTKSDYTPEQISRAIYILRSEADNHTRGLYGNNQAVYNLLRYGVPVKIEAGKVTETVHLINWQKPEKNDFVIAEEVTLHGDHERRPDIVLYVNGIAVGVLELKRSSVSIGDGIRQNISNQRPEFNEWFFSTVQFVFAGNDSEGLRYGTIGTPEKYFLTWKEDEQDDTLFKLDKYLLKMCNKERLIELMQRLRAVRRRHQKAAARPPVFRYQSCAGACTPAQRRHHLAHAGQRQEHRHGISGPLDPGKQSSRTGGDHHRSRRAGQTDRAGLHRFRREHLPHQQRTRPDAPAWTSQAAPVVFAHPQVRPAGMSTTLRLLFRDLEAQPSQTVGEVFVFVDECHRTQSGKLHRAMNALMPNAVLIGFTGTPLF